MAPNSSDRAMATSEGDSLEGQFFLNSNEFEGSGGSRNNQVKEGSIENRTNNEAKIECLLASSLARFLWAWEANWEG